GDELKAKAPKKQSVSLYKRLTKRVFPLVIVLLLFIVLPVTVAWRWTLFMPFDGQSVCAYVHAGQSPAVASLPGSTFNFTTDNPCLNTGIKLTEGLEYEITITIDPGGRWFDGIKPHSGHPADPTGLLWGDMSWKSKLLMVSRSLSRRFWTEDWFALMGSIGRGREHVFRVDATRKAADSQTYTYTFYAWRSGRFYLFVNDAINPWRDDRFCSPGSFDETAFWRCHYDNNRGTAKITVTEVAER
ncbi:MAG: hypothetical protein ACR2PM_11215, partial [Hyphomicrobiales bacterium]